MVPLRWLPALALLLASARAQTSTDCQPLERTDCPSDTALGTDYAFYFNATPSDSIWETTAGTVSYDADNGAAFTINQQGDSPTLRSQFYIFFGRAEIWMKTAPGTGIISSIMFLSDDLDEIDWEAMGGNATHMETNYFGKGRNSTINSLYYPVEVQADFHNYTIDWTNTSLDFYIDSAKVRTLLPADANSTNNYPQTPVRVHMGIWAGGDPSLPEGTREWAGGDTDFTKAPFTMYVKSAQITDYGSGKEYTYGDTSGTWESIKVTSGNSTIQQTLTATPKKTLSQKWNDLSPVARTAVYACAAAVGAVLLALALYSCIKQRRRGAQQAKLAAEQEARERLELEEFKRAGLDPDHLDATGADYDAKEMQHDGMVWSNAYSIPDDEKAGAGAAVAAGAAGSAGAAMPFLHQGATTPRSPDGAFNNSSENNSNMYARGGGLTSPQRSFSTPFTNMQGQNGMGRVDGPVVGTMPHRSHTDVGYGPGQRPPLREDYWH